MECIEIDYKQYIEMTTHEPNKKVAVFSSLPVRVTNDTNDTLPIDYYNLTLIPREIPIWIEMWRENYTSYGHWVIIRTWDWHLEGEDREDKDYIIEQLRKENQELKSYRRFVEYIYRGSLPDNGKKPYRKTAEEKEFEEMFIIK